MLGGCVLRRVDAHRVLSGSENTIHDVSGSLYATIVEWRVVINFFRLESHLAVVLRLLSQTMHLVCDLIISDTFYAVKIWIKCVVQS